jgi:chromosome segregation ATPase
MNVAKWPNPANRIHYPSPVSVVHARQITKPAPLEQSVLDSHSLFLKDYEALSKIKETADEKLEKILKELDGAQNTAKSAWSRNSTSKSLVTRLTADLELVKKEIQVIEAKMETLTNTNKTLVSLVSVHESCVKGYADYISWKEETNHKIHEVFLRRE